MGVPAFYRWVQEKYPKCVVDAIEQRAVVLEGEHHYELLDTTGPNPNGFEVDNLFIDMNGLIHPCAHPEHGEAPKTEEEMYRRIMAYVDRLMAVVRPRRVLYMAIDGVAPRAKMNQQRARRFRSAQEAEQRMEVEKEALEYMQALGHKVPSKQTKAWDSNVITPGTKFMSKLAKHLRFYVRDRINNNPAWKSIKVVFSDAGVPGEGEHKLMSYIRVQRSQPNYDPNQHHVLHGLDADLIMLGLATHEVKFSILREEVLFGKAKYEKMREKEQMLLDRNGIPDAMNKRKRGEFGEHDADVLPDDQKPLQFLHIATLREYLAIEFEPLSRVLPFPYDFERVIDDFVFLCFFVGNDFLPHLPSLDIRDGALDFLILLYAKFLPALNGYLTDAGSVDLQRVDVILAQVGAVEDVIFQRRAIKDVENERMRKTRLSRDKRDAKAAAAAKNDAVAIAKRRRIDKDVIENDKVYGGLTPAEAVKARIKEKVEAKLDKHRSEVVDVVRLGEPGWKTRYYSDKLKANDIAHGGGREKVFQTYIEGLCWVMAYYYRGVASWQWFYPFHYAPFASDLVNIDRFTVSFTEGQPFRPFEQLMGVFPAGSSHAIPKPFRWLLSDKESPIIDFYPVDIPVDPNGKAQEWLWVVLLPFIDEDRLLKAMETGNTQLTDAEKKRNERFGREIVFFHAKCPVVDATNANVPTAETPEVAADPAVSRSFAGTLTFNDAVHFPLGCIVPSPEKSQQHLQNIPNNQCLSFQYRLPTKLEHKCRLLDNAQAPAPVLITPSDRRITIPFFGKANINIIDLAGAAAGNLTNCQERSFSGDSGHGGGRGGGRGGFGGRGGRGGPRGPGIGWNGSGPTGNGTYVTYPQPAAAGAAPSGNYSNNNLNVHRYAEDHPSNGGPQYNQYLTNGSGHWGSQEPRNKHGGFGLGAGSFNYNNQHQQQQYQHAPPGRGGYSSGYGGGGRGGYNGPPPPSHVGSGGYGGPPPPPPQRIQSAFGGSLQPAQRFSASASASAAPVPRGIDALKAGLRNMHQQRGSLPPGANDYNGNNNNQPRRYDR